MSNQVVQMQVGNRYEPITTSRRTDAELDLYFGGRAAYLASCEKNLAEAIAETYQPSYVEDDVFASTFGLFVTPDEDRANWEQFKAYKIGCYLGAIEANK